MHGQYSPMACRLLYNQVFLPRMKDWLLANIQSAPPSPVVPKPGRATARLPLQALTANLVNSRAAKRIGLQMR